MHSSQETIRYYNGSLGNVLCQYCSDCPERLVLPWHCPDERREKQPCESQLFPSKSQVQQVPLCL